ncbi:CubicO group peptidase, beta-lactamase class C family [Hymenobacter daecheongensis DSM 21074]|uniref:CubicO group peptidase, beta-lactamase class C family n=2 Tax=Hymenobacter daecheongensis TaxID=496053 RepID=A0A1M6I822_9BACT|nr:CubicO group peptidase, beta-lactamase class C family [Hymenobacter daecheongensis DSM 21074]
MFQRPVSSIFLLSLLALSFPTQAQAQVKAQSKAKQLDALASQYAQAGQLNGTVLVAEHGKVIFTKGYGLANREWSQPNAADTKFRIGSLSKQFTAMLVMQLVEKGQLKLDAPISTYLPDYPKPSADKITLHQLLAHTAGLPNYTAQPGFQAISRQPTTPAAFVSTFAGLPLEFEPGTSYRYSNSGYFVLGAIIEKVTGKSYAQVLSEQILQPLRMQDTGYDLPGTILPRRAAGYVKNEQETANAPYLDMSVPYAAGALYSTVQDLYKWDQALYTTQLLSAAGRATMFKPVKNGYGYAWISSKGVMGKDTVNLLWHNGRISGFGTELMRAPQDRNLVIVLDNEGGTQVEDLTIDLMGVLYGRPGTGPKAAPAAPKAIAVDAATLRTYTGKYALAPTFLLTVTTENDQLYAQATGQPRFALVPTAPGRFAVASIQAELEFVKNAGGTIEKVILHQGGQHSPGAKVE